MRRFLLAGEPPHRVEPKAYARYSSTVAALHGRVRAGVRHAQREIHSSPCGQDIRPSARIVAIASTSRWNRNSESLQVAATCRDAESACCAAARVACHAVKASAPVRT